MYGPVSGGSRTDTAIVFAWLEPRTTKFYGKFEEKEGELGELAKILT